MNGLIVRIALRYLAGALLAKGLISADDAYFINTDPTVAELATAAIGAVTMVATEYAYRLARKLGWER